jgi:hypothetical protein
MVIPVVRHDETVVFRSAAGSPSSYSCSSTARFFERARPSILPGISKTKGSKVSRPRRPRYFETLNLETFFLQFSVGSTSLLGVGSDLPVLGVLGGSGGLGGKALALRISIPSCSLLITI